ncbi:10249_t:CDS:2 [Gigaspora margarita]|uniref:10249_t:CDS:1 n=1 Tax=Gigaspora margarita TaxID=4874 RepID=A0ABM8VYX8_GIGMA|nr:10249_t:CDS:2 [Gigaspora margarita]
MIYLNLTLKHNNGFTRRLYNKTKNDNYDDVYGHSYALFSDWFIKLFILVDIA